ncbi:MAG: hypothetical protein ACLRYY_06390 [Anaerobutyricum soehngenii]
MVMRLVVLAVGETHEQMYHILDVKLYHICHRNKPIYLMGVGTPQNIIRSC